MGVGGSSQPRAEWPPRPKPRVDVGTWSRPASGRPCASASRARNPANVYVVPQLRGGKVRKNSQRQKDVFVANMQGRALDPALAENEGKVEEGSRTSSTG